MMYGWALLTCVLSQATGDAERELAAPGRRALAEQGVRWLIENQGDDGAWRSGVGFRRHDRFEVEKRGVPHVGVTALAGLALLSSDLEVPGTSAAIARAQDFMLDMAISDFGLLAHRGTRMYSHALATQFLAESSRRVDRPKVTHAVQKSVSLTSQAQAVTGGWRYEPFVFNSDLSVTASVLDSLYVAGKAGYEVPPRVLQRAAKYVANLRVPDPVLMPVPYAEKLWQKAQKARDGTRTGTSGDELLERRKSQCGAGAYRYRGGSLEQGRCSPALTAGGVSASRSCGASLESNRQSIALLAQNHDWAKGVEDSYQYWWGHYSVSIALSWAGGPAWEGYHQRLTSELAARMREDGRWTNTNGPGDVFSTSVACITLLAPDERLLIYQ